MKQLIARFGLPALVLALLLAGMPRGEQLASAASLLAVTGTPTEPPTRTAVPPTNTPVPTPTATAGLPPRPTVTPKPQKPSKHEVADPAISKSASASEVRIGDEVTFTIRVINKGNDTAQDVVVTDPLADYLDLTDVSASRGDVSTSGKTVTVTIGALAPGEEVTIRISTRVNESAQPPSGRNGATVTTSSPGDDPSNNSSEVTFTIIATPTATIAPTIAPTPTPAPPARLPRTGGDSTTGLLPSIAALGLLALALSLVLRRRPSR